MRWRWNYEEMGDLLCGPEMQALMGDRIDKAAAHARAIAPVGDPASDPHPGLYRDSFETSVSVERTLSGRRAVGRLRNNATYAAAVEYGNGKVKAHHVLGRSIDLMRE